jgi:hypothetical protein
VAQAAAGAAGLLQFHGDETPADCEAARPYLRRAMPAQPAPGFDLIKLRAEFTPSPKPSCSRRPRWGLWQRSVFELDSFPLVTPATKRQLSPRFWWTRRCKCALRGHRLVDPGPLMCLTRAPDGATIRASRRRPNERRLRGCGPRSRRVSRKLRPTPVCRLGPESSTPCRPPATQRRGHFGIYGGSFVSEQLTHAIRLAAT